MSFIFLEGTHDTKWHTCLINTLAYRGVSADHILAGSAWFSDELAKSQATARVYHINADNADNLLLITEAVMSLYDRPAQTVVIIDKDYCDIGTLRILNDLAAALKKRFKQAPIFENASLAMDFLAHLVELPARIGA